MTDINCKIRIVTKYASGDSVKKTSQTISNIDRTIENPKIYEFAEKLAAFSSRDFVECFKIQEEELIKGQ
ncbi:hypothetical protein AN639_11760 [Candidatus Epulonipiscium fishelsonii]|uniref:Uncharacterized protein n=1 Tax=Candidatus Epulonipiscium fishelsonii TaxID=77094 RepID=A0ACC8XD32_9FIRM|nr:hypothetical protein AN396_05315 [Epulopiscium sp. SCG-B11WGA-EpuloA1]ONI42946.1 hypothetical protein AN639_11760 [Epulopiscium sp. SCG-B05WGA-EpuloA1]ONI48257.1 hypothetical protein AN643_00265 [Epulopiscium sp. SCG-B10WGA-EpuloB]